MSVAATANYPQYADANIAYIPQLYAMGTLVKYYAASVLTSITNTKYEGMIKDKGDKVIIRTRPTITIRDYTKGQDLTEENPTSAPIQLDIDKAKYYCFTIDDVDDKQADIVLDSEFMEDSAEQMRIALDTDVLGTIYADAHASNQGATAGAKYHAINLGVAGTPVVVTSANVIKVLTGIGRVMDELNVPRAGRCVVVPAWFRYLIMDSDLKNASLTGDGSSIIRNGRVGEVDGLTIYMSNLLTDVTDGAYTCTRIIAVQKDAVTFASQLVKNSSVEKEKGFGRIYKGLQVYGYKVVKPEGLVSLYAREG